MIKWPKKDAREKLEIEGFINAYQRLPHGHRLEIISKRDKPDYIVRNKSLQQEFGIELTSVYLDGKSVPNYHLKDDREWVSFMLDVAQISAYQERLANAVRLKIAKAKKDYDRSRPLLLSVFANEYVTIIFGKYEWQSLASKFTDVFSDILPFREIVFWPLANDHVFSVPSFGVPVFA